MLESTKLQRHALGAEQQQEDKAGSWPQGNASHPQLVAYVLKPGLASRHMGTKVIRV